MAPAPKATRQSTSRQHGVYAFDKLNAVLGSLQRVPRLQKIETLEWLQANYASFDPNQLRLYYGMMLHLLRGSVPIKPMVNLLIRLTDASIITQSRVNLVAKLYTEKLNSPSLGRLLQAMAARCGSGIYIPPIGQKQVTDARIPLNVVLRVARGQQPSEPPETYELKISKVNTQVYQQLCVARASSDTEFAEQLAQLVPLVEQSGRIMLGVELAVYEYLESTWVTEHSAERTQALQVIASALFRYWPALSPETQQARLIKPLLQAKRSAAEILIPHLWHLGAPAAELMDALESLTRPDGKPLDWRSERVYGRYMHIYQFYVSTRSFPPAMVVADLIVRMTGYLPLCAQWSNRVPAICATLAGEFSLISKADEKVAGYIDALFGGVHETNVLYSLANSPWIGAYPQRTFSRVIVEYSAFPSMLISSQRPASSVIKIDEAALSGAGLTLQTFCDALVADLVHAQHAQLDIRPYMQFLDEYRRNLAVKKQ